MPALSWISPMFDELICHDIWIDLAPNIWPPFTSEVLDLQLRLA